MYLNVFSFNFTDIFFQRFATLVRFQKKNLFPLIIEEALTKVCGVCRRYGTPNFYYYLSKTGEDPHKQSEYELRRDISEHVDVSFPIYSQVSTSCAWCFPSSGFWALTFFSCRVESKRVEGTSKHVKWLSICS